jgi:predicted O-methyltransferase YrrM
MVSTALTPPALPPTARSAMLATVISAWNFSAVRSMRTMIKSPLYDRAAMAGGLPRVAGKHDSTSRALARALGRGVLARLRPDEREWVVRIEARRRELAADPTELRAEFEGEPGMAPPGFLSEDPVPIGGIAVLLSIPQRWGEFLLRLVRELSPRHCLELGTALGISTAYQAAALQLNGSGSLTTLEGVRGWAAIAEEGLAALGLADRTTVEVGAIDETLTETLARNGPIDYAYLDADHSEEAAVRHFDMILPHFGSGGVAVLDDISFSRDMRRAWNAVRERDRISTSLALGRMGLVTVD